MNFVKDSVKLKCQNLAMTDLKMWRRRTDICWLYVNNMPFYIRCCLYKYVFSGFSIQLGLGTRILGLLRAACTLRCSDCYLCIKRWGGALRHLGRKCPDHTKIPRAGEHVMLQFMLFLCASLEARHITVLFNSNFFLCMQVCVCIGMHWCMCLCACVCRYMCIDMCVCLCKGVYRCVCVQVCI